MRNKIGFLNCQNICEDRGPQTNWGVILLKVLHPGELRPRIINISRNSEPGVWLVMSWISKYDYGTNYMPTDLN